MHPVSARAGRRRGNRRHPRPTPGEVVKETVVERTPSGDVVTETVVPLDPAFARRVHKELTQRYLVPSAALSAHGYGEMFPTYPEGSEQQMVMDRRVLVVRKQ